MTREEAIRICTREKECIRQALGDCAEGDRYVSPDGIITAIDYVEAMNMAISALREQEERSKGCEYCTPRQGNYGYSFAKDMPDADGPIATCIRFANTGAITLHSEAYSHDDSGAEICEYDSDATVRFRPMCGRRLEEV